MTSKNELQTVRTTVTISPSGVMSRIDWIKFLNNLLTFGAPILSVFFAQLALGVDLRAAALVAMYFFYQALADFFKKYNSLKIYPADGSDLAKKDL